VRTGGGGGWGRPADRDPAQVKNDVAEGLISAAAAKKLYGVVVRGNMSLDEAATVRLRKRLNSSPRKKKPSGKKRK
jgi:N-methylhydantoinase B